MITISNEELLKQIDVILSENKLNLADKDIVLQRCFTESWFSDTLAWLLNPKGSHGFGVEFANEFLKVIAQERSRSEKEYKSKASMLGWGKNRGTSSFGFSLKNASSIREFYLSRSIKKSCSRNARYCDVVFIDLDPADGLFLIVENKLFTSNHPNQLEEYYELVEEKFSRAKIREYVYLTIDGLKPHKYRENDEPFYRYWVNLSWIRHIKELVNICSSSSPHPDVELLSTLLTWLNKLKGSANNNIVEGLRNLILLAAAECLNEELNRLGEGKSGSW